MFSNITGPINAVSAINCSKGLPEIFGMFTNNEDYAILEDASGRI